MAGWEVLNQPFVYHPPVAPVVPEADNTAAKIISAGASTAVEAFVRAAGQRQQADLEERQMVQNAGIQSQKLALDKEQGDQMFELQTKVQDRMLQDSGTRRILAGNAANRILAAAGERNSYYNDLAATDANSLKAIEDLKLRDTEFKTQHPAEWFGNVMEFMNRFRNAAVGVAPERVKEFAVQADQMTIPYADGATFDPETKSWLTVNNQGKKVPPDIQQVPLRQIVEQYKNPDLRSKIENGLMAAGHGTVVEEIQKRPTTFYGVHIPFTGETDTPVSKPALDKFGKGFLKEAETVDLNRGKDEVPATIRHKQTIDEQKHGEFDPNAGLPPEPGQGDAEAPLPDSAQVTFGPTDTDKLLASARNALARGADPAKVQERLRSLLGSGAA